MILTGASGCDKRAADAPLTSLDGKPRMLFLVFGEKADAKALPIATIAGNRIAPIALDSAGWRSFDKLYFPAGTHLSTYHDGKLLGDAVVSRGMWDQKTPLYKLPACRALRPLAAVSLANASSAPVMLEVLASSDPLVAPPSRPAPGTADNDSARVFAVRASQREGLTTSARGELDEVLNIITTGATKSATLIASYMEPGSGVGGAKQRQYFIIGDKPDSSQAFRESYVHIPRDSAPEFRRYIDHVDITGDGVDEIMLEGWSSKSDSYLVFLQFDGTHWREIPIGSASWCVSAKGR